MNEQIIRTRNGGKPLELSNLAAPYVLKVGVIDPFFSRPIFNQNII
jgi:hypothetical protein